MADLNIEYRRRRKSELYWLKENKFYSTTPFAGFVFIHAAKSKVEAVLWYLILILFFCITARDVKNLCTEYYRGDHGTKVTISQAGNNELLPMDLVFCLKNSWIKQYKMRDGHIEVLKISLEELNSREKFLENDWDFSITVSAIDVLGRLQTCYFNDFVGNPTRNRSSEVYKLLLSHITYLNISFAQLREKFSEQFLKLNRVEVSSMMENAQIYSRFHSAAHHSTEQSSVCFILNISSNWIRLTTNLSILGPGWPEPVIQNSSLLLIQGIRHQTLLLEAPQGRDALAKLLVTSSFEFSPDNKDCSTLPVGDCELQQYANTSRDVCGCVHLLASSAFPQLYADDEICGCIINRSCVAYNKTHSVARPCAPLCKTKFYMPISEHSNLLPKHKQQTTALSLVASGQQYPVFIEQKKSSAEFLAELGGMIDLWLGASVIGLVHMFIYLVKQCMYLCNKNTKTHKNIQQTINKFRMAPLFVADNTTRHCSDGEQAVERIEALTNTVQVMQQQMFDQNDQLQEQIQKLQVQVQTVQDR